MEFLPGSRCWTTDVCVPISQLPIIIAEIQADTLREGIVGPIVSHAGDGNIHSLLLFRNDEELKKVEGLVHRMIKRAQELGGTCTGEHGIGQGKIKYMKGELGSGTVDLLRNIKEMIDPQNIMVSLSILVSCLVLTYLSRRIPESSSRNGKMPDR